MRRRLEAFIAQTSSVVPHIDDSNPQLRIAVFDTLARLSRVALAANPGDGIKAYVSELDNHLQGRPLASWMGGDFTAAPVGQVTFRYQKQVRDDLNAMLRNTPYPKVES